jgi:hypothetical protein
LKDELCSLVWSPGKFLALFFVETWSHCKELAIQNGLNIHNPSSTSLFRIQLRLVYLDPNQVSPQLVQQLCMTCRKLSISSHKNDSTQTELFRPQLYGNHEKTWALS